MNETEKFLFDLQGFIKIPNFLTTDEVNALNASFDANWDKRYDDPNHAPKGKTFGPVRRGIFTGMLEWDKPHSLPFRDLLAHKKLIPYLNTFFGR